MKHQPYIGVTGYMTPQEVRLTQRYFSNTAVRKLMVGVLVSSKTFKGIANRHPRQFPRVGRIREIFQELPNTINLIHYSTDEPHTLSSQLLRLVDYGGENLDGFQLNIPWPSIGELEIFREAEINPRNRCRIVLQLGREAMLQVNYGATEKVAEMVEHYIPLVDDVLIDASQGTGKPLDTKRAREYLQEFRKRGFCVGFGVAGGLESDTLFRVERLLDEFPDISIDAQAALRDKETDDLDIFVAETYLQNAIEMFERHQKEKEEERKRLSRPLREDFKVDIGD